MESVNKKRFLFFFVHPSKYHLFRYTINYLLNSGHHVDIAIIKKDVLEELVKQEGWKYTNIFPEGRRSKSKNSLAILIVTLINFIKTVWRLKKLTQGKKYDIYITDDCLTVIGFFRKVTTYMFIDDDLNAVKENAVLYIFATKILSPQSTDLGRFNKKKIPVKGYKELAYLHPDYFRPDESVIKEFNPDFKNYIILRLVSLTASHDANKRGLSDTEVLKIINLLKEKYLIFISAERSLKPEFEKYRLAIKPELISNIISYAQLLITDSQTMTSEAAVLGTPSVRYNDFVGRINCMDEKEFKYGLTFGFKTNEYDKMLLKISELLEMPDLKKEWQDRRRKMLAEMEDINQVMIKLFEN